MSHRNNDNNTSWGNRSSRSNDGAGAGGGYKERSWSGNRYSSDNRYNNNNKDRRNYRSYGGRNERRNYDDRRGNTYRNNSWTNNVGMDGSYMSHTRHQKNWHQSRKSDKGNMYENQIVQQNTRMHDFSDPEDEEKTANEPQPNAVPSNGGHDDQECGTTKANINVEKNDNHTSPSDEFQGFPDVDQLKASNGASIEHKDIDLPLRQSPTADSKLEMIPQENELIKLIEDEALKMITDAEQPSCSNSLQNVSLESTAPATASAGSIQNPERRSTIERSAEQVTRKLINQLTTMNKYSLKQMINNPDSKYESALKTHARQKLRAEVRRQLRNFSLSESSSQTKTTCGMLEPDECVDSDKIPDALLEQIGKVLDLNLLDLNVGDEQPAVAAAGAVEDDESVINQSDVDYSAAEVLDKNLRLNDDDGQLNLDAEDIFARAEMLLMKGSEAGLKGSSSGPSSPTEEMFPNDQIDSLVSEENGYDKTLDLNGSTNSENKDECLKEESPVGAEFTCFLRVNTVEELNKKVDNVSVPIEEELPCPMEISNPPTALPVELENSSHPVIGDIAELQSEEIPPDQVTTESVPSEAAIIANAAENMKTEETIREPSQQIDDALEISLQDSNTYTLEEPKSETISATDEISSQPSNPEVPSSVTFDNLPEQSSEITPSMSRTHTNPEPTGRKPKSSKNYKPNLVQHDPPKRESKYSTSTFSRTSSITSTSSCTSINSTPSSVTNKSHKPGPNLAALKQAGKYHSSSSSSSSNNKTAVIEDKNQKKRESNSTSPSKNTGLILLAEEMQQSLSLALSPLKPVSSRPKTPGPQATPSEPAESAKEKRKKRKRSRKGHADDIGMMLECDIRVSRPVVTPTPPPTQSRETPPAVSTKKSSEPERESKPVRETRARSVDPKMITDSRRDKDRERDRNRDKSRNREVDEKKESEKEARKERNKEDHRREKDREAKKEKDNDKVKEKEKDAVPTVDDCVMKSNATQQVEPLTVKPERERKKSPAPVKPLSKASTDTSKHSKDTKELKDSVKEPPKELVQVEKEKEINLELSKDKECKKTKETKECKETLKDREKESVEISKENNVHECSQEQESMEKDFRNASTEKSKEKETVTVDQCSESGPKKPPKKKRNLLRGPNLVKGRREVPTETVVEPHKNEEENPTPEPAGSVTSSAPPTVPEETMTSENVSITFPTQKTRRDVVITEHVDPIPALRSTVNSLVHRTASPRPWKSPGEKKLIPAMPLISAPTATVTPMSPPQVERHQIAFSAVTTPSTAMIVEVQHAPQQQHNIHCVSPPVVAQPDVLTRIGLPTATLGSPQVISFGPVMSLLNEMQDIDNKMSNFQRRKMQIDSEIMRLNSEKFQIEQNLMQLQNDRFLVLNTLRAALVECELSALATVQSAAVISPVASTNRRRSIAPEPEDLPRNKRRKAAETVSIAPPNPSANTAQISCPELSEPEEVTAAQPSATGNGSERTIRRITKISDNTQILKLFQRRRLVSEKSTEESQSEDNVIQAVESPAPAKRRRTRTVHAIDHAEPAPPTGRLRSDANRSVEPKKSTDVVVPAEQPASVVSAPSIPTPSAPAKLKKDEEIPLNVHKNLLTRQVKIVLSKLDVAGRRGTT